MITLGSHRIDLEAGRVHRADSTTELSDKERRLLALLVPRAGSPVSRTAIIEALWPGGLSPQSRALDVLFSRLRARIEPVGEAGRYLKTIRGEGFLLSLPDAADAADDPRPALPRLIGRKEELLRAQTWLDESHGRWLTLMGLGGIGKTRLASAFAASSAAAGRDVAWVDLAALSDGDAPFLSVARALGLEIERPEELEPALRIGLGARRTLLFLDNFEHLPRAGKRLGELLIRAPGVRVVATSRRALGVQSEAVFRLEGLGTIDGPALFRERAEAVLPTLADSLEDAVVHGICDAVNGHPLALELAVATLRFRPPGYLLATLRERTHALMGEREGRDPRQASIEATFAYSWEMLDSPLQLALVALSLFAGRFSNEEALAATGVETAAIHALVRHSLVSPAPQGGRILHPLVRSFARARRPALDPTGSSAARYRRYFLGWARAQIGPLRGDEDGEAPRQWAQRAHDIDAAWADALTAGDLTTLVLGWPGLREWIEARECVQEVRAWCRPALDALPDEEPCRWLRHELLAAESAVRLGGEDPSLARELAQALATAPPGATRARLLCAAGTCAARELRTEEGADLLLQAEREARDVGDPNLLARMQYARAQQHAMRARSGPGAPALRACESTLREAENRPMLRRVLGTLGAALCARDQVEEANELLEEALSLSLAAEDGANLLRARRGLFAVRRRVGDAEEALALHREIGRGLRERGDIGALPGHLGSGALVLMDLGRIEESEAAAREAFTLAQELGQHVRAASVLATLSHGLLSRGEYDSAVQVLVQMRAILDEHLPDEGYWDAVCSGNLCCAQWLAGDLTGALESSARAVRVSAGFAEHTQGQTAISHAMIRAAAGAPRSAARSALDALPKIARVSEWSVWRCMIYFGVILERGGRAPIAAALLPLLREDKGSPEKWIYLPPYEARLAGVQAHEPPFRDRSDAIAQVCAAMEELAAS